MNAYFTTLLRQGCSVVNPILNLGFALMLVAQVIRNILFLRTILILAQGAFVVYGIISGNMSTVAWNSIFILINLFQSIVWSRDNLNNLEKLNYKLWSKLQHILSKDLVGKVRRTSSKL